MTGQLKALGAICAAAFVLSAASVHLLISRDITGTKAIGLMLAVTAMPLLVLLTITRFEWALMLILGIRLSLDIFKAGEGGPVVSTAVGTTPASGGNMDPSTLLGALFIVLALVYLAALLVRGDYRRTSAATKGLYFFSGAALASAVLSANRMPALQAGSKVLAGALMFGVIEQLLQRRPEVGKKILAAAFASAIVPILLGFYQLLTNSGNHDTPGFNRVYGTAVHPTAFASYLLIFLGLTLAIVASRDLPTRSRRYALGFSVLAIVMLYATFTRSAWLALVLGIFYIVTRTRASWIVPLTLALVIVSTTVPAVSHRFADLQQTKGVSQTASANSLQWRVQYWRDIVPLAASNPVTGIGLDTTQLVEPAGLPPHNIVIQAYVEMGFVGLAALITLIFTFVATLRRRMREAVTPWGRTVAVAMGAIGVMLLFEGAASNLMDQTIDYWYAAAVIMFGWTDHRARRQTAQTTPPPSFELAPPVPPTPLIPRRAA